MEQRQAQTIAPSARQAERRPLSRLLTQAVGSGVAIALMAGLASWEGFPLFVVPFATSIVLVMGTPEAEPAQPRALIGGHLVSTLIGLAVAHLVGPELWSAAIGVGVATAAMHLTRTFHPPAGIDPLVVITGHAGLSFLLVPVGAGAVLLALFALVWHRAFGSGRWPARWW